MPSDTFKQLKDGERYKSYLKEKLFKNNVEQLDRFCNSLQTHKVLIAGGSVLAVHTTPPFKSSDIDMYVHQSTGAAFIEDLLKICDDIIFYSSFTRPVYDQSFLKRNNILYLLSGIIGALKFDIMITKSDPIDVAGNFDLSCCQIFFNGHDVWATDFKEDKTCHLRAEYHKAWYAGNYFLKKRVSKYVDRGFIITLEMNNELDPQPIRISDKNEKQISDYEEYIAIHIITYILNNILRLSWNWGDMKRSKSGLSSIAKHKTLLVEILSQLLKTPLLNSEIVYNVANTYSKYNILDQNYIDLYINVFTYFFFDVEITYIKTSDHNEAIKKTLRTKFQISIEAFFVYYLMQDNIYNNIEEMKTAYDAKKKRLEEANKLHELKPLLLEECNTNSKQNLIIDATATPISSDTNIFTFDKDDNLSLYTIQSLYNNDDSIVFRNDQFIFYFSLKRFMSMITNRGNWFFECIGTSSVLENRAMIYIKLPIKEGEYGLFRIDDIYALLSTTSSNCFEIIQPGTPVRTINFANTGPNPHIVSGKYCKRGSNMLLFRFQALPSLTPPNTDDLRADGGKQPDKNIENKTYKFVYKKRVGCRLRNVYRCSRKLFVKCRGKMVSINDVKK
jgi:hypothetical protein